MLRQSAREHCDGADGARHARKFYFSVRISYKFLISDCRKDSDLGLCSSCHLAYRMVQRSVGGSVFNSPITAILSRSEHCTAALFLQGGKNYTDVKLVLLYRLIFGTYMIFIRKNNSFSHSIYCLDTSKHVLQIVTATETE